MKTRPILLMTVLVSLPGMTAPIEFTTGINTGVYLSAGLNNPQEWTDGMAFDFPVSDYLLNKSYTAQIVPTGSIDMNESYVEFDGVKAAGFASALADGRGALEVGVERNRYSIGLNAAVSRWYTTIKNNTDEEVGFDFYFVIPESLVEITGVITPYVAASARVEATIDYLLKTPDAGSYVQSSEQIFRYYFALINDELPHGRVVKTDNVAVTDASDSFKHSYKLAKYAGVAELPMIPGRGELTVYSWRRAAAHCPDWSTSVRQEMIEVGELYGRGEVPLRHRRPGSHARPVVPQQLHLRERLPKVIQL